MSIRNWRDFERDTIVGWAQRPRRLPNTLRLCSVSGVEFNFREMPIGGAALDLVGVPLPEETISAAKESDAVLLGAIGGSVFSLFPLILLALNYCFGKYSFSFSHFLMLV